MAKKRRPSPLDEPPTASSSSDEEEQTPVKPPQPPKEDEVEEEESSSDEEEEDESEEEEEDHPPVLSQSTTKNPPPPPIKFQAKPSSSESESGTESDSEEEDAPPPPNPKVKPLASKPMDQNPNSKTKAQAQAQTQAQSSPPPNKSGTKRATENNNAHANDSKRAKKKSTDTAVPAASAGGSDDDMETEEDGKKSGEDSKKTFQRVWSEEDEITILKGITDFISKTGNDPLKYAVAFYEFVKKSLSFDATSTQLRQKIRRMRDKYNANTQKSRNGMDPTFSKPHDQKLFELSKKIWGRHSNEVEEKEKSNGKTPKSPKKEASTKNTASAKKPPPTKKPVSEAREELGSPAPLVVSLKESGKGESDDEVALSEMFRFDKGVGLTGLSEPVVRRGLEYMDESKKAELAEKWKKLREDEFRMFVKRASLMEEQARLIFEAYMSSNP